MYSQLTCMVRSNTDADEVHGRLKRLAIVQDPPYDIQRLLEPLISHSGRSITVRIDHVSRDVSVIDTDIRHHVLGTTIRAFQSHRLQPQRFRLQPQRFRMPRSFATDTPSFSADAPVVHNRDTGKMCSICMESIWSADLQCLPCAHIFHRACVSRWLSEKQTCPVCRMQLA